MKRFFNKPDLTALWEEDGDLQRMKAFFQTIETDSERNEQIKQSVKQKALEKMAKTEELEPLPVYEHEKEGLTQRIRDKILTLRYFRQWKLGLSVAVLAILVIIGQDALNGSGSLFPRMGGMQKSNQSAEPADRAPQIAASNGSAAAGGEMNAKSKAFGDSSLESGVAGPQANSLYSMDESVAMQKEAAVLPVPPEEDVVPPADTGVPRKMIHDLSLTLEVTNINDTVTSVSQEVQKLQGYVISSRQSGSDNHSSAYLTAKIPADNLSVLRDSFPAWGKVLDQELFTNDITNQYYDSQTRLQVLEAQEKRYLEILNQAQTVDDVLKVENSLVNIRQQIEQLKGQLKLWNNQVDYSTVNLQIITRQSPNVNVQDPWQPISWSETWKAARDAVLKTLSTTWNGLNYLVVGIGYALPYLLACALGWSLYRVWKKSRSQ